MPLKMFQKLEKTPPPSIQQIVAIAAGKGGVGKSSTTAQLAFALKRAGYSVGVLDADIYGPSIRKMMPEDQMPIQDKDKIKPAVCQGIKIISIAYFREEKEAVAVRAPIATKVIGQFLNQIDWGYLDYLLIDFPPGTGDIQLTLCQQASISSALIVTTPQEVALLDVRKAIHLFENVHVPILGIVENMSYYQQNTNSEKIYLFGKDGGIKLAKEVGAPFLGMIPIDPEISSAGDKGVSLYLDANCLSPAALAFDEMAKNFVAHTSALRRFSKKALTSFNLTWKEMP